MNHEPTPRLGIDFGRVIQGATFESGAADTVFLSGDTEAAMASPPSPDAFDVLPRLVELFGGRAWVISKCGPRVEERTRQWLEHHRFYDITGIPRDNVRFCRKRADKLPHCVELGITHMIDDRLDVHRALHGTVPNLYLFGVQSEPVPDWVRQTVDWPAVEVAITESVND
ncbi:hypothetical protein [Nocardia stercoris]|uniref:hypothetical protein n=1 Tax=Nocardia stercoris TaxID=2483361 RepID=UPI001F1F0B6D|nr:hypothetical protein [Nocardia stercoris]